MDYSINTSINTPINTIDIVALSIDLNMAKNNKKDILKNNESEGRDKIRDLYEENEYLSIKQNQNRARSITVGTAFGGVVEVNMRSDVASIYAQMQPTEAIELIEQLAAGVGVEIAMRPKVNFASWRGWEEVIDQRIGWDKIAWKGAAAWQLDGDHLERRHQIKSGDEPKQISPSKEKKSKATKKNSKEQVDE